MDGDDSFFDLMLEMERDIHGPTIESPRRRTRSDSNCSNQSDVSPATSPALSFLNTVGEAMRTGIASAGDPITLATGSSSVRDNHDDATRGQKMAASFVLSAQRARSDSDTPEHVPERSTSPTLRFFGAVGEAMRSGIAGAGDPITLATGSSSVRDEDEATPGQKMAANLVLSAKRARSDSDTRQERASSPTLSFFGAVGEAMRSGIASAGDPITLATGSSSVRDNEDNTTRGQKMAASLVLGAQQGSSDASEVAEDMTRLGSLARMLGASIRSALASVGDPITLAVGSSAVRGPDNDSSRARSANDERVRDIAQDMAALSVLGEAVRKAAAEVSDPYNFRSDPSEVQGSNRDLLNEAQAKAEEAAAVARRVASGNAASRKQMESSADYVTDAAQAVAEAARAVGKVQPEGDAKLSRRAVRRISLGGDRPAAEDIARHMVEGCEGKGERAQDPLMERVLLGEPESRGGKGGHSPAVRRVIQRADAAGMKMNDRLMERIHRGDVEGQKAGRLHAAAPAITANDKQ